jgi:hypothetical protein
VQHRRDRQQSGLRLSSRATDALVAAELKAKNAGVPLATDHLLVALLSQDFAFWKSAVPEGATTQSTLIANIENRLDQNRREPAEALEVRGQIEEEAWSVIEVAAAESVLQSAREIGVAAFLVGVLTSSDAQSPNRATQILSDLGIDVTQFRSNLREFVS